MDRRIEHRVGRSAVAAQVRGKLDLVARRLSARISSRAIWRSPEGTGMGRRFERSIEGDAHRGCETYLAHAA